MPGPSGVSPPLCIRVPAQKAEQNREEGRGRGRKGVGRPADPSVRAPKNCRPAAARGRVGVGRPGLEAEGPGRGKA